MRRMKYPHGVCNPRNIDRDQFESLDSHYESQSFQEGVRFLMKLNSMSERSQYSNPKVSRTPSWILENFKNEYSRFLLDLEYKFNDTVSKLEPIREEEN